MSDPQDPTLLLANIFAQRHPVESASVLKNMHSREVAELLLQWPPDLAAKVLSATTMRLAAAHLACLLPADIARIISHFAPERAAEILRRSTSDFQDSILTALPVSLGRKLRNLLSYPPDSAAAFMDPNVFTLPSGLTVAEARSLLETHPQHARYYLYVVDQKERPQGVLTLAQLAAARGDAPVTSIMKTKLFSLYADESIDDVIRSAYWHQYHELPVVDGRGTLVGIMRYDIFKDVEKNVKSQRLSVDTLMNTTLALGEMYWLGLGGMLVAPRFRDDPTESPHDA